MFPRWEQDTFLMAWHTHGELPEECVCVYAALLKVYYKLVVTNSPWAGWAFGWIKDVWWLSWAELSSCHLLAGYLNSASGHSQILKSHLSPSAGPMGRAGELWWVLESNPESLNKTLSREIPKGIGKRWCFQSIANIAWVSLRVENWDLGGTEAIRIWFFCSVVVSPTLRREVHSWNVDEEAKTNHPTCERVNTKYTVRGQELVWTIKLCVIRKAQPSCFYITSNLPLEGQYNRFSVVQTCRLLCICF